MIVRPILAGFAIVLSVPLSVAAQAPAAVEIAVNPGSIDTTLGQTERVEVVVTNTSSGPVGTLAVHIDITDPAGESSVDPEDWTLTQEVGGLEPGESRSVIWSVQPISNGTFSMYAVALVSGSVDVAVSNAVTVRVASRRTLNPEGILPVAVASPIVVGALLILNLRRSSALRRGRKA
jgi:uncharacterized membrane protein